MLVFLLRKRPGGGTQAANCAAPERTSPTLPVASTLIADDLSNAIFGQPGRPSMSDSADNQ